MLDYLIKNGLIVDGTNSKPKKSSVGILNKKIITDVSENSVAKEEIDAENKIVAPGFIDVHSHDDFKVISDPKVSHNILQGITTMIVGNCGFGVSPFDSAKQQMSALYEINDLEKKWENFDDYFETLNNHKMSINVGVLIGHHTIRRHALDNYNDTVPNKSQMKEMINVLTEGMEAGCLGFSTGLVYEPGRYSKTDEIIALTKNIKKYDGVYVSHMRNEAEGLIDSIIETANIGLKSDVKVEISHLKSVGKDNWGNSDKALNLIDKYHNEGLDIHVDQYPYTARSTMLKALLLNDTFNYENNISPMGKSTPNEVLLCSVPNENSLEGKTLEDLQALYDLPIEETVKKLLSEVSDKILVAAFGMDEGDVRNILRNKLTMIGTDGIDVGSKPHPRAWGTYPRILEKYVNNLSIIDLETAIHKMTKMPATKFGIKNRGEIKNNYFADIVIFDQNKIKDNSSFTNPKNGPSGIEYVFVNGRKSVISGIEQNIFSGSTIRK
ncbi:MAG: D-aminoacylase [Chloroflexota bacterium]|nr:D-aminoacylase [Chloroflexota bacterium]